MLVCDAFNKVLAYFIVVEAAINGHFVHKATRLALDNSATRRTKRLLD